MVLATVMHQLQMSFAVAHCNFSLRGQASDGDQAFVEAWCATHSVPFHTVRFDTKAKCAEWKKGTQETARILRYTWFEEVRSAHGYVSIATAHHAGDNVETVLMNFFRGTGIRGMHGILPVAGHIIRPLLFATRTSIEAFAAAAGVAYREDASNSSDDYLRNAIRHKLIPVAGELFPDAVSHAAETIARLAAAEQVYNAAIDGHRKKLLEQRGRDTYIPINKLLKQSTIPTLIYELITPFGFSSAQVAQVEALLQAGSGHMVISDTHRIIRHRDFLVITEAAAQQADMVIIDSLPCRILQGQYEYHFSVCPRPAELAADANTAYLQLSAASLPLTLRTWRQGDYLYPFGMGMKKKKVSRLLIDVKMPLHEKEQVRVLESGKRIAWVAGLRADERFRVHPDCVEVLKVVRKPAIPDA